MNVTITTRHLHIIGRVQGVGYRWSLTQEARHLGLKGWVRNRLDGSVEAVVSGPADAVDAIVEWAGRGPPLARVQGIEISEAGGTYTGFEQRETE
jgi:acylphosphatase